MRTEEKKFQCWLNDVEKILSFRPVKDYVLHNFTDHDAFMGFVFEKVDIYHFRVQ